MMRTLVQSTNKNDNDYFFSMTRLLTGCIVNLVGLDHIDKWSK